MPDQAARSALLVELVRLAFACNQTRVVSLSMSDRLTGAGMAHPLWQHVGGLHADVQHAGTNADVDAANRWFVGEYAALLAGLEGVQESGGAAVMNTALKAVGVSRPSAKSRVRSSRCSSPRPWGILAPPMTRILYVDRHWDSPYAMSAFVALEEKGLAFEAKELALDKREHEQADYRAVTSRIPCLVDGDFWLAESSAIAEYLEEAYPPPEAPRIFPVSMKERAVCREIQAWVRSDFMPLREERPTTSIFFPEHRKKAPLSAAAKRSADRLVRAAERLVPAGATALFGSFCIADLDLCVMLMRLHANGDRLPATLAAYAEAQWARPSVKKWVERARPPIDASS